MDLSLIGAKSLKPAPFLAECSKIARYLTSSETNTFSHAYGTRDVIVATFKIHAETAKFLLDLHKFKIGDLAVLDPIFHYCTYVADNLMPALVALGSDEEI